MTLPRYKGDVFHRMLGRGLEQISPRFGRYFFRPETPADWSSPGQTPPKPYILVPPMTGQTRFAAGDELVLGITLFGEARRHLMTLFIALERLGLDHGLTNGKGRFQIQGVTQLTPDGPLPLFTEDQWQSDAKTVTAAAIFTTAPAAADPVRLELFTPLRLKNQGALVRGQLPLSIFIDRLIGRLNTLAAIYCGGILLPPEEKSALVTLARTARIIRDETRWIDWDRDDGTPRQQSRRGKAIQFGGLMGSISYTNIPAVLLPWLSLGQWIGVGGKSSFGLGLYNLAIDEEVIE
ncbi:cytosolic protein [bacterium endosymbiont of Escarpia laminata]|nr:MAG: cytosolic protein [bacterium endosymbiont of Escarpia laminata]